jgi:hypothetical protein
MSILMGSQQGDDLQLNGDLACENAEIRSELRAKTLVVNGSPVTSGIGVENNGTPVAGGPFTSIDMVGGLVAINAAPGVASLRTTSPMPLDVLGADPGPQAGQVIVYAKSVAGVSQQFAQSDDGSVAQLTGAVPAPPSPFVDPSTGAAYTEDFINLVGVTVVTIGGGNATLRENDISTFVGDVQLASAVNGDAVAVNTSQSKLFMDLGAGITTFRSRVQPPFGPITGIHDADIVVGMVQGFAPNVVGIGTFFQAGFGALGNGNWWAVDTLSGQLADTGVTTNTGGPVQSLQIRYAPGVGIDYSIDGIVVASFVLGAGPSLAVALQAKWNDISRNGDAYHVDYLSFSKELAR